MTTSPPPVSRAGAVPLLAGLSAARPSRRQVLAAGMGGAAALLVPGRGRLLRAAAAGTLRRPGSLPDPGRPQGTADPRIPIDHVVTVMMENHSFDNYLGMLPHRGRPAADGFRLRDGRIDATNPTTGGVIRAFHMPSACQMEHEPDQSWNGTHRSVDGGSMQGFVRVCGDVAMGYWDDTDLPFYYSLASTFPLANRWFASCMAQTYPNRRYHMAATSLGWVSDPLPSVSDPYPPNGTVFDLLAAAGLSFTNYFTDLPEMALFPKAFLTYADQHTAPMARFYADCAAGTLPNLSILNPDFGIVDSGAGPVQSATGLPDFDIASRARAQGQDEENPQNIAFGEQFVAQVVNAVLQSPHWSQRNIMVIWFYDEHGGYYDHVPPPAAIPPDGVAPQIGPHDVQDGFDRYGVRIPAVVVSPWSRRDHVSNVVHDHTSVLAFLETKWNLPALTWRDANAADLLDFLDFSHPAFAEPPQLAAPADPVAADATCSTADPRGGFEPAPRRDASSGGHGSTAADGGVSAARSLSGLPDTAPAGVAGASGAAAATLAVAAWMGRRARQARDVLDRSEEAGRRDPG